MGTIDLSRPIQLAGRHFVDHKYEYYRAMLEERRVYAGKISIVKLGLIAGYEDCVAMLKDPRFVRDRSTARGGGSRFPIPLPRSVRHLAQSMIQEDGERHTRLRNLVNKAFTPRAVEMLGDRVEGLADETLGRFTPGQRIDLLEDYAVQIPTAVIAEMVGIDDDDMPHFRDSVRTLTNGLTGWSVLRTILFDLRKATKFVESLVERKRQKPADDILSELIHAEEDGDRLTRDEVVSMVFLLVLAGYETTTHLIANGVVTLLAHPAELDRFRKQPELQAPAVDEILRYRSPVHGTKPNYATEDIDDYGSPIKRGEPVMPMLAAANHDPRVFANPEVFDIAREPNHHLAFSQGPHFCLGSHLARMEVRVALRDLFERFPGLRLGVAESELELAAMPGWHRYKAVPVVLDS